MEKLVRSGIRTHAHIRGPECSFHVEGRDVTLESGALDRSAILTCFHDGNHLEYVSKIFWPTSNGGPGHRSRYLSHAKRALYHLS